MSEACHCCGGDVLQARVACLGVLSEMGLDIRIGARGAVVIPLPPASTPTTSGKI